MVAVIVTACAAFGLTVSEAKTEMMCLRTAYERRGKGVVHYHYSRPGTIYKQTMKLMYLGGTISEGSDLSGEIVRRLFLFRHFPPLTSHDSLLSHSSPKGVHKLSRFMIASRLSCLPWFCLIN